MATAELDTPSKDLVSSTESLKNHAPQRRVKSSDIKYNVGFELNTQYVLSHTEFLDVTGVPELLEATLQTVAANYAPMANTDNPESVLTQDDVYELLCKDGNEVSGRSVVLAAVTTLPGQEGRIVTATMRFVFGTEIDRPGMQPIAEMDLIDAQWPNEFSGKPYSTVATVGRYCLISEVRKLTDVPGHLTGNLLRKGFKIGKEKYPPVEFFAAIMPKRVVKNVKAGNIEVNEIEMKLKQLPGYEYGVDLLENTRALDRLYLETADVIPVRRIQEAVHANAYYNKFPYYWLPERYKRSDKPRLYEFKVDTEQL